MRIKICGITKIEQGIAIANLGATDLGFICVPSSPRYIRMSQIDEIIEGIEVPIKAIGVFANAPLIDVVNGINKIRGIQLHGTESPEYCQELKKQLPDIEVIKAIRVKTNEINQLIPEVECYSEVVDMILLDAYHPLQLGGTGQTLNWHYLKDFKSSKPWFLAGGLTPDNINMALSEVFPSGIDLSSGVEISPGDKDLNKVARLFQVLKGCQVN